MPAQPRKTFILTVLLTVIILGLIAGPAEADGKLKSFGKTLSSSSKSTSLSADSLELLIIELALRFFIDIFPYIILPERIFQYAPYPYANNGRDYLTYKGGEGLRSKPLAFELRSAYHADLDGVHALRTYAKARLSCYFTMDFDLIHHMELNRGGDADELTFFKINALFNIANTSIMDLDFGFGLSYIDQLGIHSGGNVKITCDLFPGMPLGLHIMLAANAFTSATVYETEFSLGLFFRNIEIRLGYRAMWVEDITIQGPLMGLAVWF
jgi:hypothetical protein